MSPKIKNSNKNTENKKEKKNIMNENQLNNKFNAMNIHKDEKYNFIKKKLDKNFKLESIDIIMQKLRQKRELKKKNKINEIN